MTKMRPQQIVVTVGSYFFRILKNYYIHYFRFNLSDDEISELTAICFPMTFFFDVKSKEEICSCIQSLDESSIEKVLSDSKKICQHRFNLLGSELTNLGSKINWNSDFKSGFKWNPRQAFLRQTSYIDLNDGIDVKVPWELSRFQHLITLGKAYWYTNDNIYLDEFLCEMDDWIDQNPIDYGINWVSTMDVAIRAINWIWAFYFFSVSTIANREFKLKFLRNLFLHGKYIINNLENESRGNHYLSNISGLIYLGIFFKETKEGQIWLEKGIAALLQEMEYQIYPDGTSYEGSIGYHRLVTEIFVSSTLICMKNNIKFPESYLNRLEKMIEFIMYYTKPDGYAPQIGDNDDGRLHILANYGNWNRIDHRYLISIGAVLFKRYDFKEFSGKFHEEALWLLGREGLQIYKDIR